MSEQKLIISFSLFFLFIFAVVTAASVFYFTPPESFPVNKVVTIEQGATLNEVAENFYQNKLIRSVFVFEIIGWILDTEKRIKAGEYFFERSFSAAELMRQISESGSKNNLVKITIPEGFTLCDIALVFEDKNMWQAEELWDVTGLPAMECIDGCLPEIFDAEIRASFELLSSKPANVSIEGYLFPDTYYVPTDISPQSMVWVMLENFEKKITPELWQKISESERNLFEVLTMASLLEREARLSENRKLIAGILWKRLDTGMLLQVDAVFPYIIGKNTFQLALADLKVDSPYNTYLYTGLPLGPIANPGLAAIEAAVYPSDSKYWFYLSDREGKMHYSVTYEEHLANKTKYLDN